MIYQLTTVFKISILEVKKEICRATYEQSPGLDDISITINAKTPAR